MNCSKCKIDHKLKSKAPSKSVFITMVKCRVNIPIKLTSIFNWEEIMYFAT